MATKKTPAKKAARSAKQTKDKYADYLTPQGIAVPCMPLRAFMEMLNDDHVNPFGTARDYYEEDRVSKYEYDVYQGWIVSKQRLHGEKAYDLEWIMPLPPDYSIADFGGYYSKEELLPRGKWIGPTKFIKEMYGSFQIARTACENIAQSGFSLAFPECDYESRPKTIPCDDYKSEDFGERYWRSFRVTG